MKQAIVLRSDLKMGKGKLVAQGAHASLEALRKAGKNAGIWESEGCKKIVLKVDSEKKLKSLSKKASENTLPFALIRDAGFTQIPPGTLTALAIGPAEDDKIDKITGKLKLL